MQGRQAALQEGLRIIGTLRLLFDAAQAELCDLDDAYRHLQKTNFRATAKLYQHFLNLHQAGHK